jgi:ppGpp synthetase/RelA/SpoT-type nucleotidyltranferase
MSRSIKENFSREDLIQNYPNIDEQSQLLDHINTSAKELDDIMQKITRKTEDVTLNHC